MTPKLTLVGTPLSNYVTKVKIALLEKGVPFDEEPAMPGRDAATLAESPLGKVPWLRTPSGPLCESQAILEWLEASHPEPALLPRDPWQAAKVRELIQVLELHVELVARELYPQAYFGGSVDTMTIERVRERLQRGLAGFVRLARFTPYVAGDTFTAADCSAYACLPVVVGACRRVLGEDLVEAAGIDWRRYLALVELRPSAQQVRAGQRAAP